MTAGSIDSRAFGAAAQARSSAPRGEQVALDIDGRQVIVWRAVDLERFVDAEALLSGDAPPEPPYWMHLWPGAVAAARRVAEFIDARRATSVIELGCGLGLPALVAAQRGARVVASDWLVAPLEFVRRSAAANGCRVDLLRMDWSAPSLRPRFDLCVGADVGYDAGAEAGLVGAMLAALAPGGRIVLADSVNTARSTLAARLQAAGLRVAVREVREWEEGRPVWVRLIEAERGA
jgi:ETFB lysine methyltransferase